MQLVVIVRNLLQFSAENGYLLKVNLSGMLNGVWSLISETFLNGLDKGNREMSENNTIAVTTGLRKLQSLFIFLLHSFRFTFRSLLSLCSLQKFYFTDNNTDWL